MRQTLGQFTRFVGVGLINTVATNIVFIALGLVIPVWIAYSIAFALGIVIVMVASARVVFRVKPTWRRNVLYVVWYLLIFAVAQTILYFIDPVGFVELVVSTIVVMAATVPLTFLGARFIFHRPTHQTPADETITGDEDTEEAPA